MTAEDWKRRSVCSVIKVNICALEKGITTDLEILCDFTNQPLERQLPNQELGRLLVPPNFTEGDSSGPETMGLLDTTSRVLPNKAFISFTQGKRRGGHTVAVLRAADLAASCLRGALPVNVG